MVALLMGVLVGCVPAGAAPWTSVHRPAEQSRTAGPAESLAGFAMPVRLSVPDDLVLEDLGPRSVSWGVAGDADEQVRIMVPLVIRTGGAPRAAPADFHAYLVGLVEQGVRIDDDAPARIGGIAGHVLTLTPTRAVDAGFGRRTRSDDDCFALAPGLHLRVATVEVNGLPFVAWIRSWRDPPGARATAAFDRLLASVTFDRRIAPRPAASQH